MSELIFHISIFDSVYNKESIKYLVSLDGEVVLSNFCIPGPERGFIYYNIFKVYLLIIGIIESEKLS